MNCLYDLQQSRTGQGLHAEAGLRAVQAQEQIAELALRVSGQVIRTAADGAVGQQRTVLRFA